VCVLRNHWQFAPGWCALSAALLDSSLLHFLLGLYILADAFAHPIEAGAAAVISAAFIIALAAMLLFF